MSQLSVWTSSLSSESWVILAFIPPNPNPWVVRPQFSVLKSIARYKYYPQSWRVSWSSPTNPWKSSQWKWSAGELFAQSLGRFPLLLSCQHLPRLGRYSSVESTNIFWGTEIKNKIWWQPASTNHPPNSNTVHYWQIKALCNPEISGLLLVQTMDAPVKRLNPRRSRLK